jgi:hypothetical protein
LEKRCWGRWDGIFNEFSRPQNFGIWVSTLGFKKEAYFRIIPASIYFILFYFMETSKFMLLFAGDLN